MFNRITEHEKWSSLLSRTGFDLILKASIKTEAVKWYSIIKFVIAVVLFLGETALATHGPIHCVGDPNFGYLLWLIELLSRRDPILIEHVIRVEESQKIVGDLKFITCPLTHKMNVFQNAQIL